MGRDTDKLRVISLNGSDRKGRHYMDFRKPEIEEVVGINEPDILFLPGSHVDMSSSVLWGQYKEEKITHKNETVLLYDTKRIELETLAWKNISKHTLPEHEEQMLVYPVLNVLSPKPTINVIKSFHCICWHSELTQQTDNPSQYAWRFLGLAQHLAWIYGKEILIGGDFNVPIDSMQNIVQQHNKYVEQSIDDIKPFFRSIGYMDSMTENIHRPQRRLRQLRLHKCKSESDANATEYFVASKEMKLCETELLRSAQCPVTREAKTKPKLATHVYNREITNETRQIPTQTYCSLPAQAKICIPATPPRHSGG